MGQGGLSECHPQGDSALQLWQLVGQHRVGSFPAQTGVENTPLNVCRDSISGIVGKFQSARAFPSQRALTIECSPMVGLVKAMNL